MTGPLRSACSVAVLIGLLVPVGCGSSGSADSSSDRASTAGVSLQPPEGWHVRKNGDRGLVVAKQEGDITADAPAGPRLIAKPSSAEVDPNALVASIPAAARSKLVSPPGRTHVDGRRAVSVLVREQRNGRALVSGLVVVALDPGRAYGFTLEAPADQWAAAKGALFKTLSTARFDLAAVPRS